MLITSLENDKIKKYIKLKKKKYRDQFGLFLVEGEHLVLEAYRAGCLEEIILEQNSVVSLPFDNVIYVSELILKNLSDLDNHSYIMGVCHKIPDASVGSRVLLLDGIQDPGNFGTILRSSKAFDIDTVIISDDTVDLYNPKVIRATQGMFFHLNILRRDLLQEISILKSLEIPIYVSRVEFGEDVRLLKEKDRKCFGLVMGNEGNGVRDSIMEMADKFLYIDMNSMVESLNVAIATSILLYELRERL